MDLYICIHICMFNLYLYFSYFTYKESLFISQVRVHTSLLQLPNTFLLSALLSEGVYKSGKSKNDIKLLSTLEILIVAICY